MHSEQVRTDIGLADTLIPSSFVYFNYMGGAGHCVSFKIIFGSLIKSWYISPNIQFVANRTFYVPKTPVYRFDLYGRYRILWTDELLYKPKSSIWCESDVIYAQDPSIPI